MFFIITYHVASSDQRETFSLFYGETKTNGNQKNVFWNNLPRFETTSFLRKGFL